LPLFSLSKKGYTTIGCKIGRNGIQSIIFNSAVEQMTDLRGLPGVVTVGRDSAGKKNNHLAVELLAGHPSLHTVLNPIGYGIIWQLSCLLVITPYAQYLTLLVTASFGS
jgi:hypothetical protein